MVITPTLARFAPLRILLRTQQQNSLLGLQLHQTKFQYFLQKQVRHLHRTSSRTPSTTYYTPPYIARNASMDIKPATNNNFEVPIEGETGKNFTAFLLGGLWLTLGYWGWKQIIDTEKDGESEDEQVRILVAIV